MGRMLLSICGVVVAVGLLGAGPSPTERAQAENAEANQKIAKSLGDIAAALNRPKEVVETPEIEESCDPSSDRRTSDLCAQWKAADAASRSAYWAQMGFWVSLVAVFALGGTILQGRQGLRRAQEANKIARAALALEHSPWLFPAIKGGVQRHPVGVDPAPFEGNGLRQFREGDRPQRAVPLVATVTLTNYGKSPAVIESVAMGFDGLHEVNQVELGYQMPLFPQQQRELPVSRDVVVLTRENRDQVMMGASILWAGFAIALRRASVARWASE